jgi:hypothetical protein
MPRIVAPRVRRAVVSTLLAALAVLVSGCGSAGITRDRVDGAVGRAFANLYAVQRHQLGYPKVSGSKIPSRAGCDKGGPGVPDEGPGDDWVCTVVWQVAGPGTQATAVYALHIQPDGCYNADGDGPPAVNGQRTLVAFDGTSFINPLWAFDGCFDNT